MFNMRQLPLHPPPKNGQTIGNWLIIISIANRISFRGLFEYIANLSKVNGFFPALNEITGVPIEYLSKMANEFRDDFWKDETLCPIKDCTQSVDSSSEMIDHLANKHDLCYTCALLTLEEGDLFGHIKYAHKFRTLFVCPICNENVGEKIKYMSHLPDVHSFGRKWYNSADHFNHAREFTCPHCGLSRIGMSNLKNHVNREHGEKGKIKCVFCDHASISKVDHERHLNESHQVGFWIHCEFCDFKTQEKNEFDRHLEDVHQIRFFKKFLLESKEIKALKQTK